MKKLIITLGILLMSASAIADHTTGLKSHQAQINTGTSVAATGGAIVTPKLGLFINQSSARQPNIITDPVSCVEKFGDACLVTDERVDTPQLDLGQTNITEHLVPREEGESIEAILDSVAPESEAGTPSE